MKIKHNLLLIATSAVIGFQSCKKDDHDHDENELITTVRITLTPSSGPAISATWKDLTPNEPSGQMIETLKIDSGKVYIGKIEFLDETKSPADDITAEIKKEANDHLFIYKQLTENPPIVKIDITDKDSKNLPVGLEFNFTALNKGTGKLNVVLKHQPGEKNGSPGLGDEDVNIEIPFESKGK